MLSPPTTDAFMSGGRKIVSDLRCGNWKPELTTAGSDALLRFLGRTLGESDRIDVGLAVADMDFDLDAERIDALKCGREYNCYQTVYPERVLPQRGEWLKAKCRGNCGPGR
jgi:hypothetical protein